jgi:hypothetical protein
MSDTPKVNARELRKLTESLAGVRGKPVFLVVRGGELAVVDEREDTDQLVLTCETPVDVQRTSQVNGVELTITTTALGGPSTETQAVQIEKPFDALFFSESAVDKFVVNYYSGLFSPTEMERFLARYNQATVYAVAHLPKSIPEVLEARELPIELLAPDSDSPQAEVRMKFISFREFLQRED